MTDQEAVEERFIGVPPDTLAELATEAVIRLGWRVKFVNAKRGQLSAFENKTEKSAGLVWHFEFDTVIRWRKAPGGCQVNVTVTEGQMKWTAEECRKRAIKILESVEADAQELADEPVRDESNAHGSARWATIHDLEQAGYSGAPFNHRRFILGPSPSGDDFLSIPAAETAMHATVCGPTGSGKTSAVFIPNLLKRTGTSAIVTEATAGDEPPDLFSKTAGFRKFAGHKIYKFNPDDLASHRINPLQFVSTYDQASQIANLIMENTSSRFSYGDKIWENSERQLLTVLIVHAVSEGGSLGSIRKWLRQGPDGLKTIVMKSQMVEAREEFWGFYSASSQGFRNGVVSGLMQRLNLWVNPRVVALTETTDIDIRALPQELFTFYLAVPAQKTHLKPLAALIFNFVLNLALERRFDHPLALFLDEFTNYGYVPGIAEKITILRHREIPAVLGFQDYVQLRKVYGDEDASLLFGQPGTKTFFRPRDISTAKKISEALGTQTLTDRKVTSSGHLQEREFGRPLLNPGEIMALPKGYAVTFTPSTPPVKLMAFTWQQFQEQMSYQPPVFSEVPVSEELVRDCHVASTKPDWQKTSAGDPSHQQTSDAPNLELDRTQESFQPPDTHTAQGSNSNLDETVRKERNQESSNDLDERDLPPEI